MPTEGAPSNPSSIPSSASDRAPCRVGRRWRARQRGKERQQYVGPRVEHAAHEVAVVRAVAARVRVATHRRVQLRRHGGERPGAQDGHIVALHEIVGRPVPPIVLLRLRWRDLHTPVSATHRCARWIPLSNKVSALLDPRLSVSVRRHALLAGRWSNGPQVGCACCEQGRTLCICLLRRSCRLSGPGSAAPWSLATQSAYIHRKSCRQSATYPPQFHVALVVCGPQIPTWCGPATPRLRVNQERTVLAVALYASAAQEPVTPQ